jgi:hypothetical protein
MRRDLSSLSLAAAVPLSRSSWEKPMPKARSKGGHLSPIAGTTVPPAARSTTPAARLGAFLRRQHPVKTAIAVEATCGVREEAIKKVLAGRSVPSFESLGRLLAAYGPELLVETMDNPPEWLRAAAAKRAPRKDGEDS